MIFLITEVRDSPIHDSFGDLLFHFLCYLPCCYNLFLLKYFFVTVVGFWMKHIIFVFLNGILGNKFNSNFKFFTIHKTHLINVAVTNNFPKCDPKQAVVHKSDAFITSLYAFNV